MNRNLTEFQQLAETKLLSSLEEIATTLVGREVLGMRETYIRSLVRGTDIVVYIYDDEAQFHVGPVAEGIYETSDFRSPELLLEKFIADVCARARLWFDPSLQPASRSGATRTRSK